MVDEAGNVNDATANNVESEKPVDSQLKNPEVQNAAEPSNIKDSNSDGIKKDTNTSPNTNSAVKFVSSNVENITINLQIVLATKEYKIRELNNLKVSDVIKIGAINDYILIYANDLAIAKGELVNGDEGVVVEIIEIL